MIVALKDKIESIFSTIISAQAFISIVTMTTTAYTISMVTHNLLLFISCKFNFSDKITDFANR
jgi:hypothetical protein